MFHAALRLFGFALVFERLDYVASSIVNANDDGMRPAAVNDDVRHGTAVQTGVQSRSELTFKDQTITRLGEKTIFSVGDGPRAIDLGSGQFLLYAPKKAGGAKVKMGPVTAAISG